MLNSVSHRVRNAGYCYTYDDVIFLPGHIDFDGQTARFFSDLFSCSPV